MPKIRALSRNAWRIPEFEHRLIFSIGKDGAGLPLHEHAQTWSELIIGRKRWSIYHPTHRPLPPPGFSPMQTHVEWLLGENYTMLAPEQKPLECVQQPGEVVYLPDGWLHGTVSLGGTAAFTHNGRAAKVHDIGLSCPCLCSVPHARPYVFRTARLCMPFGQAPLVHGFHALTRAVLDRRRGPHTSGACLNRGGAHLLLSHHLSRAVLTPSGFGLQAHGALCKFGAEERRDRRAGRRARRQGQLPRLLQPIASPQGICCTPFLCEYQHIDRTPAARLLPVPVLPRRGLQPGVTNTEWSGNF